jgi:hypothetical protein
VVITDLKVGGFERKKLRLVTIDINPALLRGINRYML